jgi:hypothetical protein
MSRQSSAPSSASSPYKARYEPKEIAKHCCEFEFQEVQVPHQQLQQAGNASSAQIRLYKFEAPLPCQSIGCKSHLLNLEANAMIADDNQLESLLDDVRQDMTTWKNSNKN